MDTSKIHVAVIGAGPAGLAAIKSLLEEGFQVTCFERRPDAGGLWAFSDNPQYTSVTKGTRAQLSKFLLPFSDYPVPDDFPRHPKAEDLVEYYQSYAAYFDLLERIVFNATVSSLTRSKDDTQWALQLEGEAKPRLFNKVVVASGSEVTPIMPVIEGLGLFEGKFLHSQAFKKAEDFAGKNVVVIGQGNTACDSVVELSSHSSKVYWAHRRGVMVFPRIANGQRFDAFASWKATRMGFWVAKHLPSVHRMMFDSFFSWIVWKSWGKLDPQWRLDRNAYYATTISGMIVNDNLVPVLRAGKVTSTAGLRRVLGPRSVELDDGTILEGIDAIVACTGYSNSLKVIDNIVNYSRPQPDARPQPDLYQGIFPLGYTDSLACLNYIIIMDSASMARELAAMAVAQVWAGKSSLPSASVMESWVRKHQAWFAELCLSNPLPQYDGQIQAHGWLKFVNEMAGTGVYEHLGWTLKGIRFWMREPKLCSMMAGGVNTPHIYRVFETGKRKAWEGAKDAIKHVNEQSKIDLSVKHKAYEVPV
ncbi:flavin containing monooxygenase 9 [Fusarium albosuccineum]|uniref:Flavin containing monooxygenase 9 n=1 Tax=Fusarium albosuccineum TaxID=1237068 RepID=A0A8H4LRB9_9HYPO|nr:flavin containing monooxygenase 9 [Fusarium albosuccineum]